jgi:hypothetical protein
MFRQKLMELFALLYANIDDVDMVGGSIDAMEGGTGALLDAGGGAWSGGESREG